MKLDRRVRSQRALRCTTHLIDDFLVIVLLILTGSPGGTQERRSELVSARNRTTNSHATEPAATIISRRAPSVTDVDARAIRLHARDLQPDLLNVSAELVRLMVRIQRG